MDTSPSEPSLSSPAPQNPTAMSQRAPADSGVPGTPRPLAVKILHSRGPDYPHFAGDRRGPNPLRDCITTSQLHMVQGSPRPVASLEPQPRPRRRAGSHGLPIATETPPVRP